MADPGSLQGLLDTFESHDGEFLFLDLQREMLALQKESSSLSPEETEALVHEWLATCLEPDSERDEAAGAQQLPSCLGLHVEDGRCELRERDQVWTITSASVAYWRQRARQVKNPELSARYAHLAWVFARPVGLKSSIEDARLARAQYLAIAATAPEDQSVSGVEALRRAAIFTVGLPGALGQDAHDEVLLAYIDLASRIPEPQCPLIRRFLMDDLVLGRFAGKFGMTDAHETLAFSQVRKEFDRDPPANWVENANPLIKFLTSRRRIPEAESLARELVERLRHGCESGDAWLFQHWARRALPLVQSLGLVAEEEVLHRAIEGAGHGVIGQMQSIEVTGPIPPGVLEQLERRVGKLNLKEGLALLNEARPGEVAVQRAMAAQSASVLLQLGVRISLTSDGVPTHMTSGPMSEGESLRRAWIAAVEASGLGAQFLWRIIMETHQPDSDDLLAAMSSSEWIPPGHERIIHRAYEALAAGDDLVFLHLAVPQFEPLLRHLVAGHGRSIYHVPPTQPTSLETDNLSYLIGSDVVVTAIGDEGVQFLKTLLVEDPGFKLRHGVAHGLMNSDEFTQQLTVLCVQGLLVIARANDSGRQA